MIQPDNTPVLVTGGSGFVGRCIVRHLRQAGWRVRILARRPRLQPSDDPGVQYHQGNVLEAASLQSAAQGCFAIIHLVGIIQETRTQSFEQAHVVATQQVLAAGQNQGIKRYIHMSALGTRDHAAAQYHQTKWRAEELVRGSSLNWTIFRPGLIHGPGGEFTNMVIKWHEGKAPPFLFMPYFGGGLLGQRAVTRVQPILVDDVAALFVKALETPASEKQIYDLGGPDQMTWPEMLDVFNAVLPGARRRVLGIPFWLAKALSAIPLPGLPFNRDQVIMAGEDSVCGLSAAKRDFPGFSPQSLESSLRHYV
jgi:NADH dehydrogenase